MIHLTAINIYILLKMSNNVYSWIIIALLKICFKQKFKMYLF